MLPTRLTFIAILIVAFIAFLMSNLQPVKISFLVYSQEYPLFYVMGVSVLFGSLITFLFLSLLSRDKRLKEKLKKVQAEKNQVEKVVKAQKKEEKAGLSFFAKSKKPVDKDKEIANKPDRKVSKEKNKEQSKEKDTKEETYKSPFL